MSRAKKQGRAGHELQVPFKRDLEFRESELGGFMSNWQPAEHKILRPRD